eukprot:2025539-Rhodomonas_salina.1
MNNYAVHHKAVVNGFNKVFCSVLDEKLSAETVTAPFFKEKASAPVRFPYCFINMGEPMTKSNENAKANKDLVSLISNGKRVRVFIIRAPWINRAPPSRPQRGEPHTNSRSQ